MRQVRVTALSIVASRQVVRIDIESLPTGMLMPSCRAQFHAPRLRTVSNNAASSPGCPAAAIQLAESLTSPSSPTARRGEIRERFADRHAARCRRIDQRQWRPLAHRDGFATIAVEVQQRDRDVGDRHLPRARPSGSRAHNPPTVRSPMEIRNVLSATAGNCSTRFAASRRSMPTVANAGSARATRARRASSWAACRAASTTPCRPRRCRTPDPPRSTARGRSPCRRRRKDSARARRSPRTDSSARGVDGQYVTLLRLVAPDLSSATCPALRSGSRAGRSMRPCGRHARFPAARSTTRLRPTSWIERIGLSAPNCQQRSMTSCARR